MVSGVPTVLTVGFDTPTGLTVGFNTPTGFPPILVPELALPPVLEWVVFLCHMRGCYNRGGGFRVRAKCSRRAVAQTSRTQLSYAGFLNKELPPS
jgi:hypothetical protein